MNKKKQLKYIVHDNVRGNKIINKKIIYYVGLTLRSLYSRLAATAISSE
jgi:hypothetical protein